MLSEIRYEVDQDDLLALHDYHAASSPLTQSALRRQRFIWPSVFLALGAVSWVVTSEWAGSVYFVLCAVIWPVLFPRWAKRKMRKHFLAAYSEGRNPGILGPQSLRAEPDFLLHSSEQGESQYRWGSIERVAETPSHAFIYTGAVTALIVPKRDLDSDQLNALLGQARSLSRSAA